MILSILAAASENNILGKDNQLVWTLKDDTAFFKNKTLGHTVIMGRKTFDSMGKPLPKRRNIIVSRNTTLEIPQAEVIHSLNDAIGLCRQEEEVFLIGGAELYKLGMSLADRIYLTRVHANIEGDAYFPELDPNIWKQVHTESFPSDSRNDHPFSFLTYERF